MKSLVVLIVLFHFALSHVEPQPRQAQEIKKNVLISRSAGQRTNLQSY